MATQYFCSSELRREVVRAHGSLNGIDYLEVLDRDAPAGSPRQQTLLVKLLKSVPGGFIRDNVFIEGGVRIPAVNVLWAYRATSIPGGTVPGPEATYYASLPDAANVFVVRTDSSGDFSQYRLLLTTSTVDHNPPANFDTILSQVEFSFKVECPSDFDCKPITDCPEPKLPEPLIDYLTKDYTSFRRLMLDRLSATIPDWTERNAADVGIAMVEVMAYAADYLSYYQDAVATEAYLGTARRRVSMRRHARMLDYPMHDGSSARTWIQISANAANVQVPAGTQLATKVAKYESTTRLATNQVDEVVGLGAEIYETMHEVRLYSAHNTIQFYTWLDQLCCLPKGATKATLLDNGGDRLRLRAGDVLIFEEVLSTGTGQSADADPAKRHAVRLTRVVPEAVLQPDGTRTAGTAVTDPANATPVVEIEWAADDALPFTLCISSVVNGTLFTNMAIARGNIVVADHGRTITAEPIEPAIVPDGIRYRPRIARRGVTQSVPYDLQSAIERPASEVLRQSAADALPAMKLTGGAETWVPRRDLLNSDRFATDFVLEVEDDGYAYVRFGDNVMGKKPVVNSSFTATYRIGNGSTGNVGAGTIAHIFTAQTAITGIRNPMPAQGGAAPESIERVRLYAPQAFRKLERAVTRDDYSIVAQRHPEVQRARATHRWTGSWHTTFLTVDRRGGLPVDAEFEAELRDFLERYRLMARDIEIDAPRFVPLDIILSVCVEPGYFRSSVKNALINTFSSRALPDGTLGFFHPDNFTFNQPVYLSQILARASAVPGVSYVQTTRFQRQGNAAAGEIENGVLPIGSLEIARLDNDRSDPENGKIEFNMQGGL